MKRETFAKIAEQKHPSNPKLYIPEITTPDDLDISISKEIIDLYHKCQSNNSDGEWKWIDDKRIEYIKALQDKDVDKLSNILCNFFLNKSSYGIISPSLTEVEDYMKDQVMCDIDTVIEFSNLNNLDTISLEKNKTGNPFGIDNGDKIIQFDFPRNYYYSKELLKITDKNIVEIGGGFGSLDILLRRLGFDKIHFNIDLVETGLIYYYFLKKNKIKVEFLTKGTTYFEKGTTYIIPSDIYKMFEYPNVGVVCNFNSFSEMNKETVDDYINFIQDRIKPDYIYHQNSNFLLYPNSVRHIEYIADDFKINKYKLVFKMISPFFGGAGRYRIYKYKKIKNKILQFQARNYG